MIAQRAGIPTLLESSSQGNAEHPCHLPRVCGSHPLVCPLSVIKIVSVERLSGQLPIKTRLTFIGGVVGCGDNAVSENENSICGGNCHFFYSKITTQYLKGIKGIILGVSVSSAVV